MNEVRETKTNEKRPYEKPSIVKYPLRPTEAVLANCKVAGISGPGGSGNCAPLGGPPGGCSVQAS